MWLKCGKCEHAWRDNDTDGYYSIECPMCGMDVKVEFGCKYCLDSSDTPWEIEWDNAEDMCCRLADNVKNWDTQDIHELKNLLYKLEKWSYIKRNVKIYKSMSI